MFISIAFIFQSLFVIFQKLASEKDILNALLRLPPSGKVLIIEEKDRERYLRWKSIKNPARKLNEEYRMLWWKNTEANYKTIKEVLNKKYMFSKKILNPLKELPV